MRGKGITYDTGYVNSGSSTRDVFDPEVVAREMRVIREELHCDTVRVTGTEPERLELAGRLAAEAGLAVWLGPFTCDHVGDELLLDCAERAERLRKDGADVVFVAGAELSILSAGFLPGATVAERLELLNDPRTLRAAIGGVPAAINAFFAETIPAVRERFHGLVTYASIPFEGVDWSLFDIVSVDFYRAAEIAHLFEGAVRTLVEQGKPVAITEFGSATFSGAGDLGARGGMIVEWDGGTPLRLDGDYPRDEEEQATYLREVYAVFAWEGVAYTFANTFAGYHLPHRAEPRDDLDRSSYGVVKVYDDLSWQPKAAFAALADLYR
ncbi:hypothetical protein ACIBG8_02750 [Nonomuraea sp. NPDC050556]|uniref:hypothetical protein n=1 Tax=Nonomuraea sp. NPDC050556 TaxID=3364369 RepID=UPI0037A418B2